MSRLMSAVSGINDEHIIEFSGLCTSKKRSQRIIGLVALVACFVFVAVVIPSVIFLFKKNVDDICSNPNAYPNVVINGKKYHYDGDYAPLTELPNGYDVIGSVLFDARIDEGKEGFSLGCKVGDIIYQNPNDTNEIFVYTTLFKGNGYWFIRFVQW